MTGTDFRIDGTSGSDVNSIRNVPIWMKCDKLITAEASAEYELENMRLINCRFDCPDKLKINFNDGKDFNFENVEIIG